VVTFLKTYENDMKYEPLILHRCFNLST